MDAPQNYLAVIKVVGIGGGGVNAVNRMIEAGLRGVEFTAVNTDAQTLLMSDAEVKLDIGRETTRGSVRVRSRRRTARRGGARRRDRGDPQGRRHGVHHRRRGRRNRDRRRADRRGGRAEPRRAHDRGRDATVRLRGPQAGDAGRPRDHGAEEGRRHAHRRAERPAAAGRRREHADDRRVPDGGPGPVSGRRRHHVVDHDARAHQPRLRGREVDHGRRGLGVDGDRARIGRGPGDGGGEGGDQLAAPSSPRSTARRACCSRSPVRPTSRCTR